MVLESLCLKGGFNNINFFFFIGNNIKIFLKLNLFKYCKKHKKKIKFLQKIFFFFENFLKKNKLNLLRFIKGKLVKKINDKLILVLTE
jgi:hypothetical protein